MAAGVNDGGTRALQSLGGFDMRTVKVLRKCSAKLESFILKIEARLMLQLGPDDIKAVTDDIPMDGDFKTIFSSIVEVLILPPWVLFAVCYPSGGCEYIRVSGNPLDIEKLTDSDYFKYQEELMNGRQHWPELVSNDSLSEAMKAICGKNRVGGDPGLFNNFCKKAVFLEVMICSSHRIFSHAHIAGYPRTIGDASYIMEQVGALECNMIKYSKQHGLGITPRILIVAQSEGTTDYGPPEKLKYGQHVYLLRTENIERAISEMLQKKPDMIIGSDREGNERASLLAQDLRARQVCGEHATQASWWGGARMFARVLRKLPKD